MTELTGGNEISRVVLNVYKKAEALLNNSERGTFEATLPGKEETRAFEIAQLYPGEQETPLVIGLPEANFALNPSNPFFVAMEDKSRQPELSLWDRIKGKRGTNRTRANPEEVRILSELLASARPDEELKHRSAINSTRETVSPEAENEVKELLQRLEEKGDKAVFVFIIDNSIQKTHDIQRKFVEKQAEKSGVGYVTGYKYDGEEAIKFFKAFKQQAPDSLPVVVYLDNNLVNGRDHHPKYRLGMEVIKRLGEICKENGWAIPYLIGGSSDDEPNEALNEAYPDLYCGKIYDLSTHKDPLENLEEKVFPK